jgi:hypothetical protein
MITYNQPCFVLCVSVSPLRIPLTPESLHLNNIQICSSYFRGGQLDELRELRFKKQLREKQSIFYQENRTVATMFAV